MTDYHSMPQLSSSEIATYLTDPIRWWHQYVKKDWKSEASDAMRLGTAVHRMIELGGPDSVVREIPPEVLNAQGHCKGKAWTDWKEANPAEVYLKPGEQSPLTAIWQHLMANRWCREVIENSVKELEHFWYDEDLASECRMKTDALLSNCLVDWKTTAKTSGRSFAADVVDRYYDVRLAFYRRGFRHMTGVNPSEVFVVAINTSPGYKVTPYRLPNDWLDEAEARLLDVVDQMSFFSLDRYLDSPPVDLVKPEWAKFSLPEVECYE